MESFNIRKNNGIYEVLFKDDTGMSILSREKSLNKAKKRLAYHAGRRSKGYLLKEDASVWKLMKVI
jgi:hypothetical protein